MKICSISDVHIPHCNKGLITPDADVLTISGDLTSTGQLEELVKFREWLVRQPQKHKVLIAGNHDFCLERKSEQQQAENILGGDGIVYLRDQSVTIDGIHFYGAPWQPWFYDWAFNLQRGPQIAAKWDLIPDNVDVLLVHGPPFGYGDLTLSGHRAGCEDLLDAIKVKNPRYVCYGHIHEDTGIWRFNKSVLINCSMGYNVGFRDTALRNPYVFDIEPT